MLPVAPTALSGRDLSLERLIATLDSRGALLVGDQALQGPAAVAWWAEQAKRRRAGRELLGGPADELPTLVIVRADRDAPYGAVRSTLETAQEQGFAHFTLVVLRELQP